MRDECQLDILGWLFNIITRPATLRSEIYVNVFNIGGEIVRLRQIYIHTCEEAVTTFFTMSTVPWC